MATGHERACVPQPLLLDIIPPTHPARVLEARGPVFASFQFLQLEEWPTSSEQLILLLPHSDLPDAKSRALDNIGRVFARVGKFQQAIDT